MVAPDFTGAEWSRRHGEVKLADPSARVHVRGMADLSRVGEIVRRHDPDRFFTALFAPADRREALFTLYAFNHELARAHEVAREPMMALIRLQWWREVVEGARRQHEVAAPLGEALETGSLAAPDLLAMIEAREMEADPIETLSAWCDYVRGSAGGVAVAASRALGGGGAVRDRVRDLGAAYGAGGMLRSVQAQARHGRCLLPLDVLTANGVDPGGIADADPASLRPVFAPLVAASRSWLARGRAARLPPCVLPAVLPAVLARHDLRHAGGAARARGALPWLAVAGAALFNRL